MKAPFKRIFAVFEAPGYPLLAASGLAFGATWTIDALVQGWVVLQLTDSPFWVGAAAGIRGTSQLLFSLVGGAIADRRDRRRTLIAAYLILATLALVAFAMLAVWRIPPWVVVVVTAAGGALIRAIGA